MNVGCGALAKKSRLSECLLVLHTRQKTHPLQLKAFLEGKNSPSSLPFPVRSVEALIAQV